MEQSQLRRVNRRLAGGLIVAVMIALALAVLLISALAGLHWQEAQIAELRSENAGLAEQISALSVPAGKSGRTAAGKSGEKTQIFSLHSGICVV